MLANVIPNDIETLVPDTFGRLIHSSGRGRRLASAVRSSADVNTGNADDGASPARSRASRIGSRKKACRKWRTTKFSLEPTMKTSLLHRIIFVSLLGRCEQRTLKVPMTARNPNRIQIRRFGAVGSGRRTEEVGIYVLEHTSNMSRGVDKRRRGPLFIHKRIGETGRPTLFKEHLDGTINKFYTGCKHLPNPLGESKLQVKREGKKGGYRLNQRFFANFFVQCGRELCSYSQVTNNKGVMVVIRGSISPKKSGLPPRKRAGLGRAA